jgi:hypothetical protein
MDREKRAYHFADPEKEARRLLNLVAGRKRKERQRRAPVSAADFLQDLKERLDAIDPKLYTALEDLRSHQRDGIRHRIMFFWMVGDRLRALKAKRPVEDLFAEGLGLSRESILTARRIAQA